MKIDGRAIAQHILDDLKKRDGILKSKGVTPHLAIIFVGNDPASDSYIKQKVKKAEEIGTEATVHHLPNDVSQNKLLILLREFNNDDNIHGIIVQRPLPNHINVSAIDEEVDPKKDVDGFHPNTKFSMPIAMAALRILEEVYKSKADQAKNTFIDWIGSQNIVVIGKGKTGGGPIIHKLRTMSIEPKIIDSKTRNPERITRNADIIVSTAGKPNVLTAGMLNRGVIVIGVGLYRGPDGKMHGDYEEEEIKDIASYYTPTPGGVGPVNVAMLLENLIIAAEKL